MTNIREPEWTNIFTFASYYWPIELTRVTKKMYTDACTHTSRHGNPLCNLFNFIVDNECFKVL